MKAKDKFIKISLSILLIASIFGFVWHTELIMQSQADDFRNLKVYLHNNHPESSKIYFGKYYSQGKFTNGFFDMSFEKVYHLWLYLEIAVAVACVIALNKRG